MKELSQVFPVEYIRPAIRASSSLNLLFRVIQREGCTNEIPIFVIRQGLAKVLLEVLQSVLKLLVNSDLLFEDCVLHLNVNYEVVIFADNDEQNSIFFIIPLVFRGKAESYLDFS